MTVRAEFCFLLGSWLLWLPCFDVVCKQIFNINVYNEKKIHFKIRIRQMSLIHILAGGNLQKNSFVWSFPGGSVDKESACQSRRHKRYKFDPWVRKISWRRKWQPTSVFLPGESHGQRSLVGYSPWGRKESDMTEGIEQRHEKSIWGKCEKNFQGSRGWTFFLINSFIEM